MQEVSKPTLSTSLGIGVAGLGIGWLVGLSTSPVVAAVIATLLAAVAALAGGQSSGSTESKFTLQVSPAPLVALVVGIAIGSTLGMTYRNGSLFNRESIKESPEQTVQRWVALGADKKDVVQRLLDRELPARSASTPSGEPKKAVPIGLVADADFADICVELSRTQSTSILSALAASTNGQLRSLADEAIKLKASTAFAEKLRSALCPNL